MTDGTFFDESTEQSRVKTSIVRDYFAVWAKVVLKTAKEQNWPIAYIDLFSGPGLYKDGTRSTPLRVLEIAIADQDLRQRLITRFNDADKENARLLREEIAKLPGIQSLKYAPKVTAIEVSTKMAEMFEKIDIVPTLLFADPWGYKGLSLDLIRSVLKNWGCDCVFFFNFNRINMGIANEIVEPHMNLLFGEKRANELRGRLSNIPSGEREAVILETLSEALREHGAKYVLPFCFKNEKGSRTSHHLVLATKHQRGYAIMKDIMARQSSEKHQGVPSFGYCPAPAIYPVLFELSRPLDDLEGMLLQEFAWQTRSLQQIYDRHNAGRPYILQNYRAVLLKMEAQGLITVDPSLDRRKKNTFAPHVRVTFPALKSDRGSV